MAGKASESCDCGWPRAACEKLQRDVERFEQEINHLKNLLWKSPGSWRDKDQAIEDDIVAASEEVVNAQVDG